MKKIVDYVNFRDQYAHRKSAELANDYYRAECLRKQGKTDAEILKEINTK